MAISLDYGKCDGCGQEQSKTLQNCRHCGMSLPWTKSAQKAQKAASGSIGVSDIAWAAMGVQIFGGILFLVGIAVKVGNITGSFPTIPFLGYIMMAAGGAIWGYGSQMD